jgi:endonuclease YncB( thermonuclease family)
MTNKKELSLTKDEQKLIKTLKAELEDGRKKAIQAVEDQTKITYWNVGKHIKKHLLKHEDRADYGTYIISTLSKELDIDRTTLYQTIQFYEYYPKIVSARGQLSWTHIRSLLTLPDETTRREFESRVLEEKLSTRELDFQIKDVLNTPPSKIVKPESTSKINPILKTVREEPYVYRYKTIHGKEMVDLGFRMYLEKPNRPVNTGNVTHYTYKAYVVEVIDGDTMWVDIDLGFNTWTQQKVRLRGINTQPIETKLGLQAKEFIENELKDVPFIALRTYWRDKFTRYLVDVFYSWSNIDFQTVVTSGQFLNQKLLDKKLGIKY